MEKELNIAPLSAGFMVTSIVGFVISIIMIYPRNSTWGFTLTLFFFLMFVAAMVSLTYAPDNPKYQLINHYGKISIKTDKNKQGEQAHNSLASVTLCSPPPCIQVFYRASVILKNKELTIFSFVFFSLSSSFYAAISISSGLAFSIFLSFFSQGKELVGGI